MAAHRRTLSPSSPPPSIGHTTLTPASSTSSPRIVSKLALEGKAKNNGANVKLFLKLTVPVDSVAPGMPVSLFSDESLKIVNSIVHPLDPHGVPYAFSSSILLQASRSLGLANRSSKSYVSLFPDYHPEHPLDHNLTGHISVVDYQVSYILPREFPPHVTIGERQPPTPSRLGALDRNSLYFMAAIDIVLPFQSVPPFAPYVLSIPIPRCLSNTVKFGIIPPSTTRWDLSTTPTITPRPPGSPKSVSSSASSLTVENDELMICGSFPSAGTFEIRFALPDENADSQGRRRVGVREVNGLAHWRILERRANSLRVSVAWDLKLKGIWYAGVATLVGMDLTLEDTGIGVHWAEGGPKTWEIHGSSGYTGFGSEPLRSPPGTLRMLSGPFQLSRSPSSSSLGPGASLLHASLPVSTEVPDYSFETNLHGSSGRLDTPISSQVSPSATASRPESLVLLEDEVSTISPLTPVVVHFNMSQIGVSDKSTVDCAIYGELELEADEDGRIALPTFLVPSTSVHKAELLVQSDIEGIRWISGRARDPISLKRGVTQRCQENTVIILSDLPPFLPPRPTIAHDGSLTAEGMEIREGLGSVDRDATAASFIPHVQVSVTPLLSKHNEYSAAVRIHLPCAPSYGSILEFGLASWSVTNAHPAVQLVAASMNRSVVDAEVLPGSESAQPLDGLDGGKGKGKDWVCWVKVDLSSQSPATRHVSGEVEIIYLVNSGEDILLQNRAKINALLPCFTSKVGWLEVQINQPYGWTATVPYTNLMFQSSRLAMSSYTLEPYHFPALTVQLTRGGSSKYSTWLERCIFLCLGAIIWSLLGRLLPLLAHEKKPYESARAGGMAGTTSDGDTPWPLCNPVHPSGVVHATTPGMPSNPALPMPLVGEALLMRVNALLSLATIYAGRLLRPDSRLLHSGWDAVRSKAITIWELFSRAYHFPLPP